MGALFPCGFGNEEALAEQDRIADKRLHQHAMQLRNSIKKGIEKPGKNKTIGNLLRSATPLQKVRVRKHLETEIANWSCAGAPIEAGIAERALEAFDAGKYDNGHIARYLTEKVIEKIFL